MKNTGPEIERDRLAEAMKQTGLGTPATCAEIIEKPIRTGYVQRERTQLRAARSGRVHGNGPPGWHPGRTAARHQTIACPKCGRGRVTSVAAVTARAVTSVRNTLLSVKPAGTLNNQLP